MIRNPQSAIRNPDDTILAFAGDPAVLGMIARAALGSDVVPARPVSLPEPLYPALSRKRGEEGRVLLEVTVSAEGGVRSAEIQTSSSHSRLDRAALEAVKRAIFTPATESGVSVESTTMVAYRFELK